MKKGFNQMIAIVMIAVSSVAFTGCYGSFSLTSKLHNWNGQVSNAKFVNELVFLGYVFFRHTSCAAWVMH